MVLSQEILAAIAAAQGLVALVPTMPGRSVVGKRLLVVLAVGATRLVAPMGVLLTGALVGPAAARTHLGTAAVLEGFLSGQLVVRY